MDQDEKKQVKQSAVRLLAQRNHSSYMLRRKLLMKGFSETAVDEIVLWAQDSGYVQDDEYLRAAILSEHERGHGPKAILWKLRAKGFPAETVEMAIDRILPIALQQERIRALIFKRPMERQKMTAALLRRGYDFAVINEVLRNFKIRQSPEFEETE
jgi:regulatory protein